MPPISKEGLLLQSPPKNISTRSDVRFPHRMPKHFLALFLQLLQLRSHDALIRLDTWLIERIDIRQLTLVGNGHRKHVEQLAEMIRRQLRQCKHGTVALVRRKCIGV